MQLGQQTLGATRWKAIVELAVIAITATAFRLPYIASRSIWYDESSSWQTAQFSLTGVIESLSRNVHFPFYYYLLKMWMAVFGDSVVSLRALSIIFGVLTAMIVYSVAREILTDTISEDSPVRRPLLGAPMVAGLLVAVNAFQINASIEARMYSLGTMLSAASAWALLRVIRRPEVARYWTSWFLACIALMYTHHHCLFVVASEVLLLLGIGGARRDSKDQNGMLITRRAIVVSALLSAAYVPGAMLLYEQLRRVREDYWTVALNTELIIQTFAEFISPLMANASSSEKYFWGTLFFAVLALSLIELAAKRTSAAVFCLALGFGPLLLAGITSVIVTPVWEGRFFRFAQPFLLLAIALASCAPRGGILKRRVIGLTLVVLVAWSSVRFWDFRNIPHRTGMKGAVSWVRSETGPQPLLLCTSNVHYFPAKYYCRNEVDQVRLLEAAKDQFWGDHLFRESDFVTPEDLARLTTDGVWVISHSPLPGGAVELGPVVIKKVRSFRYDAGVPDWRIYASFVRSADR